METWNDIRHADILAPTEDSASVPMNDFSDVPSLSTNDEVVDMGTDFDFEGFQVVRREFFAHLHEPSVTFNNYKFYVNCACLNKFPEASFVQVLVNQETKIMALRPCVENARDSFAWCGISKKKRSPRQITCKLFFAKMFSLMDWNPDYRYKLLGRLIHANGEYMIAFDLTATEVYQRALPEGAKPQTARTPVFPSGWQDQFGLPYKEHQQSMQVNIFDGYAVYSIKESSQKVQIALPDKSQELPQQLTMEEIIRDLLESYGLSLGTRKAPCVICAVSTLEQIYQTHGYHMRGKVLSDAKLRTAAG